MLDVLTVTRLKTVLMLFSISMVGAGTLMGQRIVFPQAAVGPLGEDSFVIELHLANRDPNLPWSGAIRLLAGATLAGMQGLELTRLDGTVEGVTGGVFDVELGPEQSTRFRIRSDTIQVGVLVIEGQEQSSGHDVVPSFFYRLEKGSSGRYTDLIAVQPILEPSIAFNTVLSKIDNFDVGIALVSEQALDATKSGAIELPVTEVDLKVILLDGATHSAVVKLGGTEAGQKALFPSAIVPGLPESFETARLQISTSDPVYVTLLGVGTPPLYEDVQIGATPAIVQNNPSFELREGWDFVEEGSDLVTGAFWGCASSTIRHVPGGLICGAGKNWESSVNALGPHLEVSGDFGVLAAVYSPDGESGSVTAVGSMADGPEWWRGLRRLDFGVSQGQAVALVWDDSPSPQNFTFLGEGALKGNVHLEMARIGSNLRFFVRGQEVGEVPDPGLFRDEVVYLGTNVSPESQLTVFGIAAAKPAGTESVVVKLPPFEEKIPVEPTSLRSAAEGRGLRLGAAVAPEPLADEWEYRRTFGAEFNMLTAENVMKWQTIHPQRETYNFCPADSLMAFAARNGMSVRGHLLLWHNQNPGWLVNGNFSRDELIEILRTHIFTVASYYRGQIAEWDVINEGIDDSGNFRQTLWYEGIGPEYIEMAFRWAREADPSALLFYNDYSILGRGRKSDAVYDLVRGLIDKGVPIDGVGFQGHIGVDPGLHYSKQQVLDNLARFDALGLAISLTEVDVRIRLPESPEELEDQAVLYAELLETCLETAACGSFVTWGFTDRYSWIPGFFTGFGAALLFDDQYQPKPAYYSMLEVLQSLN